MEINWKVGGITAATAFIISIFSAGITGVSFGLLLLRGVISAVVFGALGTGVYLLVKKQLPELIGSTAAGAGENDGESGANVDIVLDDDIADAEIIGGGFKDDESDIPDAEAADEDGDEPEDPDALDSAAVNNAPDTEYQERAGSTGSDTGEDSEEVSELEAADEDEATEEDSLVEEVEEVEDNSVEDDSAGKTAASGSGIETEVDVDRLPDLENFSDTFVDTNTPDSSSDGTTMDSLESNENDGQDPAVIARAVRTVLKRDQ